MSRFENRLWSEIVEQHGALLSQPALTLPARAATSRARAGRRLSLAGVAASFAAVIVSVVLLTTSGSGPAPAYAITQNSDGTVTITVREVVAVPEVDEKLEALGLPIRAVEVKPECTATSTGRPLPNPNHQPLFGHFFSKEGTGLRIDPRVIPRGDTLVIAATEPSPGVFFGKAGLWEGPVPSCLADNPTGG
jgi:hypothetical protein